MTLRHIEERYSGTLRSDDGDGNKNGIKAIDLLSKTTTLHVHHTFLYISLPFLLDYDVKMPFSCFIEDVNKQRRNFLSLSEVNLDNALRNTNPGDFAYLRQRKRDGIIALKIEFTF